MAQLIVRNIEEALVRLLRIRAARHGRSAEAEHREILREALQPPSKAESIKALLLKAEGTSRRRRPNPSDEAR